MAFSSTASAVASASATRTPIAPSFTSVTLIVNAWLAGAAVIAGGQDRHAVTGIGLVIKGAVYRHDTRIGVNGKPATGVVAEASRSQLSVASASVARPVRPTVVPTRASSATVLAPAVRVGHGAGVKFIDVANSDCVRLGRGAAGCRCWWPGP